MTDNRLIDKDDRYERRCIVQCALIVKYFQTQFLIKSRAQIGNFYLFSEGIYSGRRLCICIFERLGQLSP